ncbi:hypothetical protein CMQ_289 [Grosmannia clavigera kw1407]|uniref:Ribosome-assembly protein 3 C-terminal domain-containing protein n=1 Tax=Grosmannia clavigera (strain kw1407 / UAMH 11150) TaxID=655863 RepID=F0XR99_GROCL|nr:uncharacterized protein CMQ_289 [Grosmannia clavigera kw1407]EFW99971.1 hypothetical protein CMQ_289 [Grosmannia clavigera kw1407]
MASSSQASSVSDQFQAYYLQRATVELAEDLDTLRKADDFAMSASRTKAASASARKGHEADGAAATAAAAPASTLDTPLQMLIEALRQGAEMFGGEDQKRVVAGVAARPDNQQEKP